MMLRKSSSSSSRRTSERTSLAQNRLSSEAKVSYSDDCDEHVELLKKFWRLAHDDDSSFVRVGNEWTAFGFQRDDPVSDLRGGGVLALRNLVNFLDLQPEYARVIMTSRRHEKVDNFDGFYPFAAAGINVTGLLCGILEDGSPSPVLADFYDECYALCFRLVDKIFDERKANYMGFNAVLKEAGERLRNALDKSRDADDVSRFLKIGPSSWGTRPADMKGFLEKLPVVPAKNQHRAAKGLATAMSKWRLRQFCLRGDLVAWFKNVPENHPQKAEVYGEPRHVQLLPQSSVRPHLSDAARFEVNNVKINSSKKTRSSLGKIKLRARSPADAQRWMAAMLAAIQTAATSTIQNIAEADEDDEELSGAPALFPRSPSDDG